MRKYYTIFDIILINFLFLRNFLFSKKLSVQHCYPLEIFAVEGGWITLRVEASGCHLISIGNHFHVPGNVTVIHLRLSQLPTPIQVVFHGVNHSEEHSVSPIMHKVRKDYNVLAALQQSSVLLDKQVSAPFQNLNPPGFNFGVRFQHLSLNPNLHLQQAHNTSPKLFFQPIRIYKWKEISIPPPKQIS